MAAREEPVLRTDPELQGVLDELSAREPLFHRGRPGNTRVEIGAMVTDDFWEVGASGRRYGRDFVLDVVAERCRRPAEDDWHGEDFHCRRLGPDVYLLTYTLVQGDRVTRRSTVWEAGAAGRWRAIYHQGTVVAPTSNPG
jgi:hypothetical protein